MGTLDALAREENGLPAVHFALEAVLSSAYLLPRDHNDTSTSPPLGLG